MAWLVKQRGSRRGYYYRTRRIAGRAFKEYVGTGPRAEAAAAQDAKRRRERLALIQTRRREEADLVRLDQPAKEAQELLRLLVAAHLILSGYHEHRGQWRRRKESTSMKKSVSKGRGKKDRADEQPAGGTGSANGAEGAGAGPDRHALFLRLIERANGGDQDALRHLGAFLDQNPWLWQRAGDLTAATESAWVNLLAGQNALASESIKRRVAGLKRELEGEQPTRLEALLVEQIAVTWLACKHAEQKAACAATGSPAQDAFKLKRAESAQKRFNNAIKTLALLRSVKRAGLVPANQMRLHEPGKKLA